MADGITLPNGEWRPTRAVTYAPIFVWPPRPFDLLKWGLSFPGFLWPWNSIYLAITLASYYYFQPAVADFADLTSTAARNGMAVMFARNLVLLCVVAGGWHLALHTLRLQGKTNKYDPRWPEETPSDKFLFHSQLLDNIFWSCASGVPIWTAYEVLFQWAWATGRIPYVDWAAHPVYATALLVAIPFWREFHFYWIHRAIHWGPLYKAVHALHHKNVNPIAWSGMAMHPVEHLFYFSVLLLHWVVPSHPLHMLFNAQHTALTPAGGHHGFEGPVLGGVPTGSYFHYLHHRYFECNYGEATLPLDWLFGTFRDGAPNGAGSKAPVPAHLAAAEAELAAGKKAK